jgi:hypothetical protein
VSINVKKTPKEIGKTLGNDGGLRKCQKDVEQCQKQIKNIEEHQKPT